MLHGSCQENLSLSLGSSHCLVCPTYWPVILALITAASIVAGMLLVIILLVLNITVTAGLINEIIYFMLTSYLQVVALSSQLRVASVFQK